MEFVWTGALRPKELDVTDEYASRELNEFATELSIMFPQAGAAITDLTSGGLSLSDDDTLILRGDRVSDATTLTLAPRLQSKLVLLERVPREVSL